MKKSKKIKVGVFFEVVFKAELMEMHLNEMKGFECPFRASDLKEAIEKIKIHPPDILYYNCSYDGIKGLKEITELRKLFPELKIISHSYRLDKEKVAELVKAGSNCTLYNHDDVDVINDAFVNLMKQDHYYTPFVIELMGNDIE